MASVTCRVEVFFSLPDNPTAFTLDDPVKGELDSTVFLLAGDLPVDVTVDTRAVSIARGRSDRLENFEAGTCSVELENRDRDFDPSFTVSPYAGNIRPGKRVRVSCEGVVVFDGRVEDWELQYEPGGFATATLTASDRLADLARRFFTFHTTTAGEFPGDRIDGELNRGEVGFPAGPRSIDTGAATLLSENVTHGSNVLNYLQLITQTEQGALFASRTNVLTFRGRRSTLNRASNVRFADDGTGVDYTGITVDYGSEQLFTRVQVDRETGVAQTAVDATAVAEYGVRTLSLDGLLYDDDAQSLETAQALLARYSQPELRVKEVGVLLTGLAPGDAAAVASLDLGDTVEVVFSPPGPVLSSGYGSSSFGSSAFGSPSGFGSSFGSSFGSTIPSTVVSRFCIVEGITHDITPDSHRVTVSLSDADRRLFLELDDPIAGRLDAGVLAW